MTQNNTGTYVYDKELKKVVKVSSCVPGVHKKNPSCGGCCGGCSHGH